MTATVSQLPPALTVDLDTERAVLGGLMLQGRVGAEVLHTLTPDDFYRGLHGIVFAAIRDVIARNVDPDPTTVYEELESRGRAAELGNPVFLADCVTAAPTRANLTHYAARIAKASYRRQAITRTHELTAALNDPTQDASAAVQAGAEDLLSVVRGDADGIVHARDMSDALFALREDGPDRGLECGWPSVDRLFRPSSGQLSVVTGVPSHGKSSWLDAYLTRMWTRHSWRVAWFTPERAPLHKHAARLLTLVTGEQMSDMPADRLAKAIEWLDGHAVWVDVSPATVEGICAAAALEDQRCGLDAVVIDPWNWIEATKERDEKLTEFIGRALTQLARFAERRGLHVFVVAHPTKMRQNQSDMTYDVPRPYDISESANWANKAWWCLSVWRDHLAPAVGDPGHKPDRDPALVDVHVQKVRDDDQGRVGVASLRFDTATRRYAELETRRQPV